MIAKLLTNQKSSITISLKVQEKYKRPVFLACGCELHALLLQLCSKTTIGLNAQDKGQFKSSTKSLGKKSGKGNC